MEKIKKRLAAYAKKTITLTELEKLTKIQLHTYEDFANTILLLEEEGVLIMVKAKGRNGRTPSLAFQYRINKSPLKEGFHQELQRYRSQLHQAISIDFYFNEDPSIWKRDLPFIQKIDHYIAKYEFPTEPVPAPERSYELVGDEKWITEKGGKELLEQLGIYEKLNIIPVSDPLMFAMNPNQLTNSTQLHLIVENKTTYQGLLPELTSAMFSTLIYGSGKKIVKSIEQFQAQYPIEADHHFLYFGDIDREGIAIWHSLNKRTEAHPALPFYRACLAKTPASGKEYQREQQEATVHFLSHFRTQEQTNIKNLLNEGNYLPQETLKTKELQQIWRETDWTEWI